MKNILTPLKISITFICITIVACSGPKKVSYVANVEQEIKAIEERFSEAFVKADTTTLNQIYSEDYQHIHGRPATKVTRKETMAGHIFRSRTKSSLIKSVAFEVEGVQVYGDIVIATGLFAVKRLDKEGRNNDVHGLFTHVWVSANNLWQLVASHHSPK